MSLLPVNNNVKFAKLLSTNARFANLSLLSAIAVGTAGLTIITGLRFSPKSLQNPLTPPKVFADSASTPASSLAFAAYDRALASIQAQLTSVSSPTKLGKSGILTITDSGILKPTDHNQTQGGIGTDVSRIGKIWGTFMDLNDDVSINGKLDLSGKLTANGVVVLGNNDGDIIEVGGRFTSNLVPSQNNAVDIGTTSLRWRTGYFVNSIVVGSGTTTITDTGITTTGGSSTTITSSLLNLVSTGTLQLDTSTNNNNILLLTGTGNVGIGSTSPGYKLDVTGTGRFSGAVTFDSSISVSDLSCTDCLDFDSFEDSLDMDADTLINGDYSLVLRAGAGAVQNSTSGSNDLQLSAEDKLILAGASFDLSTSNGAVDIISNQRLDLSSGGTLTLDTSANNSNIQLQAGSGNINLSSTGTITLTGNTSLNNGTLRLNGLTYTFPGSDTANGVLLTDGSGVLSWTTGLTGASLADDTLDFVDFQDELDLDADTSINGDQSLIIRAGLGSIQNSTSGSNDLQLSAEDKLILAGASFDLSTSNGAVDIISNQRLDLSSGGTLTLDTSQNNSHIVLTPGTGNIGIGSTAPVYKLDVNGTLRTTSTARIEGALTVTTGGASVTGDLTLDGDLDFTGAQNITTTSDDLTLSPTGNLIIDTSGGTLSIRDAGIDLTNQPTTISGSTLSLRSTGTFIIDTSANNTDIRLQAGSGNINLSSTGTITLTGNTSLNNGTLRLNGLTYTFPGADTASGVLISNGSGLLSWNTIGASNVTADSLDFSEFKDELTLDADTSINGDYSLIVRTGLGARQNATSGSNDLQLSAEDQILIHGSALLLETSSASAGQLVIRSDGTLQLDTSANNTNIALQAGSGNINLSSTGTITLTGNTSLNNGTLRLNGLTYTFPGADSANGVLLTDGSGLLSWTTGLTGASLADDTLDFVDFQDELDLDADTSINGDYSLIVRAGLGAIQNSTSGSNDLQLSAEDKLIFDAASLTLTTSNGPIDILSRGYLDLSSTGTLTLDTSQNNSNILLKAGSGSINLSSGTTTISGNLNLNSGTLTLNGVAYTFPGADGSASQALTTNASGILSWSTIGVSADSLDFTDLKDTLTMDSDTAVNGDYSLILRAGLGAIQNSTSGSNDVQISAEDRLDLYAGSYSLTTSGNSVDILSGGRIDLSAKGTLTLDTSQNNSQILIRAGTGRVDVSGNTILVNAGTGTLTLSSSGGITIGGEGATTRVSGDLNFTGRLLEDGNEIFANQIAAFAAACPTGWSEYTNARGRVIVGNVSGGTVTTTVGTAFTIDGSTRQIYETVAHTHAVDPQNTSVSVTDPGHAHSINLGTGGGSGGQLYQADDSGNNVNTVSSTTGITAAVDIGSFTSGSTGSVSVDVTMPYIQLTYCQKTAGADYAEWTRSREQYEPGTIVSADPQAAEQIKITEKAYDSTMLGIISTTPGWSVGVQTADSLQLALNGRVPVKIDPDSEPIAVGDFLTSSAKPGLAMKATKMGYSVGKALESWSCSSTDQPTTGKPETENGQPKTDNCKDSIIVFVNLGTYLGPLTSDGYIDTGANFIAGDIKIDLKKAVYQQLMSELNLPSNFSSNLPQNPLNSSNFPDPSDPSNPSFPSSPDTVSASVSQVLGILTEKLDKLSSQVDELAASAAPAPSSFSLLPSSLSLSTSSGANVPLISSKSPLNSSNLSSSGDLPFSIQNSVFSILSSATVGGNLTVGLLTINDIDASINSMGETLRLQNLGLANVEIMVGKVVIDTKGNLVLKSGDLSIETGRIAGNSSFRDSVILPAGQGSLRIDTSWDTVPVTVNLTPTWNTAVWVEDLSGSGFTVNVSQPPTENSRLFWLAIW